MHAPYTLKLLFNSKSKSRKLERNHCLGNGECACNVGDTRGVGCVCAEGWEGEACGCTTLKTDCMFNTKVGSALILEIDHSQF